MRNTNQKNKGVQMKVTFNTLKKHARKGELFHTVKREFSGMTDGLESNKYQEQTITTLEDLNEFKASKNFLEAHNDNFITLSNCVYHVEFEIKTDVLDMITNIWKREDKLSTDSISQLGTGLIYSQEMKDGQNKCYNVVIDKEAFKVMQNFFCKADTK